MPAIQGRDGNLIHYRDFSFALPWQAQRPVILVHGLGCTWEVWLRQIPALANSRRVIAIECRGSGASRPAQQGWTMWDMGDDIATLVESLGLDRPDVVGLSMGGAVAMHFAIAHPVLLNRLITIGAPVGAIEAVRATRGADFDFIQSNPIEVIARKRMERAFTGSPDPRHRDWMIDMISSMNIDDYRSQARAGVIMDLYDRLDQIQAPHEVINGEAETVVIPTVARYIVEHNPRARLHLIPGGRHFWNLEEPEACNALLLKLLADQG